MISRKLYQTLVYMMIVFFLFLILYQFIVFWQEKRTNDKYFAYNAFGFGKQRGEQDGFRKHSFGYYGIFSQSQFPCTDLIEGYENNNTSGESSARLEELVSQINDLSNNLYSFASQLNLAGQQQLNSSNNSLPVQPVQVTGADIYSKSA